LTNSIPAHDRKPPPNARNRSHITAQARATTPLGDILLAASEHGLAGLWFDGQTHHPGVLCAPEDAAQRHIARALAELDDYWQRPRSGFETPLDVRGTEFQRLVWRALREIAPGSTVTYRELASRIGRPEAARAVGAAVGRNPISIIVPCHRVVGTDGSLTGYAGGLPRKRSLLELESR
jgi:methylated-DNA-[protein]-cysteine S-methyltransferase